MANASLFVRALAVCALVLASLVAPYDARPARAETAATKGYVIFSINVQDFSYPEKSAETVNRIIDIHEAYQVPVDIYLTTTMTDLYERVAPALLERLRTSPFASASYHIRPPKPYYTGYDWAGVGRLPEGEQYEVVRDYETHGLDLTTGLPTDEPGGYEKLKNVLGYAPFVAAAQPDADVGPRVADVFRDLGARFFIQHDRISNLGDTRDGVYLRPEHYDLKLFEQVGVKPKKLLKNAFADAAAEPGAVAPYFVGIKMHDNDFFAVDSSWVTVYVNGPRHPPFDTTRMSALLDDAQSDAVWSEYEKMVAYVSRKRAKYVPVNAPMVYDMLGGGTAGGRALYVSGTMHIESNVASWPDPDALVAFFERATATGMRWSVGADIGWLEGEPRAADVIRATEALGVEWDVHAHELADRANCYAAISRLGGHPNHVASGLLASEIDALRGTVRGDGGATWQAEVLWGIVLRPGHGEGADDRAAGVWRPESSSQWTADDPAGTLVAVGGGSRELVGIGQLANDVATDDSLPAFLSATVMVSPRTLTIVDTTDGIEAIEAFAADLGARPQVHWATIRETADAWRAAGSVPSRTER